MSDIKHRLESDLDRLLAEGAAVEGQVVQSYSGRKELFFSKQMDLLAKFKDGQRVTIIIIPND